MRFSRYYIGAQHDFHFKSYLSRLSAQRRVSFIAQELLSPPRIHPRVLVGFVLLIHPRVLVGFVLLSL